MWDGMRGIRRQISSSSVTSGASPGGNIAGDVSLRQKVERLLQGHGSKRPQLGLLFSRGQPVTPVEVDSKIGLHLQLDVHVVLVPFELETACHSWHDVWVGRAERHRSAEQADALLGRGEADWPSAAMIPARG